MTQQAENYDRYIRPFNLVEKLNLHCGYEKSFKLTHQQLLRNRYLLGIEKTELDKEKLHFICQQLQMPQDFLKDFFAKLEDANLVFVGFEEGAEDSIYKMYLEYWDKVRVTVKQSEPPYQPLTMFLGYKWSTSDNTHASVTDYLYYPMLTLDQMVNRLEDLFSEAGDKTTFEVLNKILLESAEHTNSESLIYLEASEANNPRKSFDINFYRAGLKLQNIYPLLIRLCRHYSINIEQLDDLYNSVNSRDLGHLSGGRDRQGRDFFTVYYDTASNP